jgi:hypothetical protein
MFWPSRTDRVRKSPPTVAAVGWPIRNTTWPVFHKGNSSTKEKEKRTKKEKENACGNAAAMEICHQFGGLRRHLFYLQIPTAAWKSSAKNAPLFHIPTGAAAARLLCSYPPP